MSFVHSSWRMAALFLGLAAIGGCQGNENHASDTTLQTIYLVRHAEKAKDGTRDPALTDAGNARAKKLSTLLRAKNITRIFSTDYQRTQQTAAPIAKVLDLQIESYDPRDLKGFAAKLKAQHGNILVVGHSNTTPALANALGDSRSAIDETVYDRLYVLQFRDKVLVSSNIELY